MPIKKTVKGKPAKQSGKRKEPDKCGSTGKKKPGSLKKTTGPSGNGKLTPKNILPLPYETYLEQHKNVSDAIAWQQNGVLIRYREWDLNPATSIFNKILAKFYNSIAAGRRVPFAFKALPGQDTAPVAGVAPGLYGGLYLAPVDAAQIYLAYVAQALWVEVNQKVPWRLHNYTAAQLSLLLQSPNMFSEGTAAQNAVGFYQVDPDKCGTGMPGDPTNAYRFFTSLEPIRFPSPIIRNVRTAKIFVLFRWIRDHLCHGPWLDDGTGTVRPITGGDLGQLAYGYRGPAPIQSMFNRTTFTAPDGQTFGPNFFAWIGCHSAGALAVWVLRTLNIPCLAPTTYWTDDNIHTGIDFPAESLFAGHMDDFYAMLATLDPGIGPSEIFEHVQDYAVMKQKYTANPPVVTNTEYNQALARKGLGHPTYRYVNLYWEGLVYSSSLYLDNELTGSALFSPADLPALHTEYDAKLQATVDAFKQKNGLQNATEYDAWQAYQAAYTAWENKR